MSQKLDQEYLDEADKLTKFVPAGIDYRQEIRWIGLAFLISLIYSLSFFVTLLDQYDRLFERVGEVRYLIEGAMMPDFSELLGTRLIGFYVIPVGMLILMGYHYFYHYLGSKSIYLMRRLPNRWTLLKRCVTLPVIAILVSLGIAFVLLLIYYGIYHLATPASCLSPGQWQKIWHL